MFFARQRGESHPRPAASSKCRVTVGLFEACFQIEGHLFWRTKVLRWTESDWNFHSPVHLVAVEPRVMTGALDMIAPFWLPS